MSSQPFPESRQAMSLHIFQAQSLPEIADPTLRHLHYLFQAPYTALGFFDFEQDNLILMRHDAAAGQASYVPLREVTIVRGWLDGQPEVVVAAAQVTKHDAVTYRLQQAGMEAYVRVPVLLQGDLMGVIVLGWLTRDTFARERLPEVATVAQQVAVAVQQLRLRTAMGRHLQELTVLDAVTRASAEATSEADLLGRTVAVIRDRLYREYFDVLLLDEEGGFLRWYDKAVAVALSDCLQGVVIQNERMEGVVGKKRPFVEARLCAPLKVGQRLIGVVVAESTVPGAFGEADIWFVSTFARQLAMGVDRLRVESMERQRALQMAAINKIGQAVTGSLDLEKVLQRIVDLIPPLVNAEGGAVLLLEQGQWRYGAVSGARLAGLQGQLVSAHIGLWEWVLATKRPLLQHDVQEDENEGKNGRSLIAIPLQIGQEIIGILTATHTQPHTFHQNDLQILERTAAWVSIAIDNARLHEQVRRHATELEERVQKRTIELQQTNDELSQYAYAVSHDLRTPLRGIRNYADFLQEDLIDTLAPEQKRYLGGLLRAVREADQMVDGLLTLSRISSRDLPLEAIDLNLFLRGLITSLELSPHVIIHLNQTWPTINTEAALLRQIFQNLILNGVKFNQSATIHIHLCWQQDDHTYQFSIKDNGIGIDSRYQERIFGVFERLHTYQEYAGTGIGLAIVRKAVRKLGGSVTVQSTPGQGSTFTLTLPKQPQTL